MSFGGFGSAAATPSTPDYKIPDAPTDTISELHFNPAADYLAASSWDHSIRIYQIGMTSPTTVASQGTAEFKHDAPVLTCRWSNDGAWLATGGCDRVVKIFDAATMSQLGVLNGHEGPVKAVRWVDDPSVPGGRVLASAGWDKTVKYWDPKTQNLSPVMSVGLQERAYTMDVRFPYLVVGTAERHLHVIDVRNPGVIVKTMESTLKFQTRVVSCFTHGNPGFVVGSIEGRCSIQYIEDAHTSGNFTFKCHRGKAVKPTENDVYPVHSVSFHPLFGTFATTGGDGSVAFWDKDNKSKLKSFEDLGAPVTASGFSRDGRVFGYALGYDWAKGVGGAPGTPSSQIGLMVVKEDDIKNKNKKK